MGSTSFTKLFSSITDSSIWQEPAEVRVVWVTLLAMADQLGRVFASNSGLARRANVSREATELALAVFLAPDADSRTPEHEGRRIEAIAGGWQLLNYKMYREMKDEEARREKNRVYQERHRERESNPEARSLGYIYYAQNGGRIKIGYSKNPWSRIHEMRCACPDLQIVGLERGTLIDEKERHEMFSHIHHDREWFDLDKSLFDHISNLPKLDKVASNTSVAKIVANYDQLRKTTSSLRRATSAQAEAEAEEEEEAESTKTSTSTLASSSNELPAAPRKLVCTLPLNQGDHQVFEDEVMQWQAIYLAVDIRQELRNMKGWLLGNPKLRKTKTGIGRFINAWMSRAQNEAKPTGGGNGRNQSKTSGNLDAARGALAILAEAERNSGYADEMQPAEGIGDESGDLSHLRTGSIEL